MLALEAATTGRRGPGHPGSARVFPGESASPAASFGAGMALDVLPGSPELAAFADAAAADSDRFDGVADHELIGVLRAWDRVEAHAAARKLALVAELIRRRPEADVEPESSVRIPAAWDEFVSDELAAALGESRGQASNLLTLARDLAVKLPGTWTALCDGSLTLWKARLIAAATHLLNPAEASAAEQKVLNRAGRLTPGGLRAAIARAVMEVAPDKSGRSPRPSRS
jgi:hypothetical protein